MPQSEGTSLTAFQIPGLLVVNLGESTEHLGSFTIRDLAGHHPALRGKRAKFFCTVGHGAKSVSAAAQFLWGSPLSSFEPLTLLANTPAVGHELLTYGLARSRHKEFRCGAVESRPPRRETASTCTFPLHLWPNGHARVLSADSGNHVRASPLDRDMTAQATDSASEEAKRVRAELRLALAQADELLKRAEAVLKRSHYPRPD